MAEIIGIRFKREGKSYHFDPGGLTVRPKDGVIVETSWGLEYGECVRGNTEVSEDSLVAPLRRVVRMATSADLLTVQKNRERERDAFRICQKQIAQHGLDMNLVDVEYGFEGSKILFFFTAEGRVDFRSLVKDLASVLHSRIELRQIGVRDEAKLLGGLGICGRPFCCNSFLTEFQPVSIKMAKTQGLSLNPTKISGTCGRLMCCLKYEQEAYEDLLRSSPKQDSFVETPDGVGDIVSVNTLRERVTVRLDHESHNLKVYHKSEIRIIRAGKGRRPEDYRPPSPMELEKLRRVKEEVLEEVQKPESYLVAEKRKTEVTREASTTEGSARRDDKRGRTRPHKGSKTGRAEQLSATVKTEVGEIPDMKKPSKKPRKPAAADKVAEKPVAAKEAVPEKKARRPYWRKKTGKKKPNDGGSSGS